MTRDTDDDARLAEISQQLTAVDVDDAAADRIARTARAQVGHGPSRRPLVESLIVALVATSFFAWALMKVLQIFE